jgi:hypothetical protein
MLRSTVPSCCRILVSWPMRRSHRRTISVAVSCASKATVPSRLVMRWDRSSPALRLPPRPFAALLGDLTGSPDATTPPADCETRGGRWEVLVRALVAIKSTDDV